MRHFASAISRTEASNRRVAVAAGATTSKHALGNHHLGALVQFSLGLSGTQCQISVRQDSGRQRLIEARGTMAHTRLRCQVSSVSLGAWTSGQLQDELTGSSSVYLQVSSYEFIMSHTQLGCQSSRHGPTNLYYSGFWIARLIGSSPGLCIIWKI